MHQMSIRMVARSVDLIAQQSKENIPLLSNKK